MKVGEVHIAADEGKPYPTTFRTVQGLTLREFVRLRRSTVALGTP